MEPLNEYQEEQLVRRNESIQELICKTLMINNVNHKEGVTALICLAMEAKLLFYMDNEGCTPYQARDRLKSFFVTIIDQMEDEDVQDSFDHLKDNLKEFSDN